MREGGKHTLWAHMSTYKTSHCESATEVQCEHMGRFLRRLSDRTVFTVWTSHWKYVLDFPAEHPSVNTCTGNTVPKHEIYLRRCTSTFFHYSTQSPQFPHIPGDELDSVDLLLSLQALRISMHWSSFFGDTLNR